MSNAEQATPVVEFAGAEVSADAFFVTPVDRDIEIRYNDSLEVFRFRAGEPRQLPAAVIREALGMGVQVAG